MPRRSFDDSYWGDSFVQELNKDAKLLFAYLWTNKRCNSAGLYEITLKTIAFETGIELENIPALLEQLSAKVKWLKVENLIWVINFLKHQPKSPQFLTSVAGYLSNISSNGLVKEYLEYYSMLGVSIPYQYPIQGVSSGYGDIQEKEQELEPELVLELELDKEESFGDFRKRLKTKYTELDIAEEYEKFKLYWAEGKRKLKRPKFAFVNWLNKAKEIKSGKGFGENAGVNKINSDDKDKYIKGKYGHMVRR